MMLKPCPSRWFYLSQFALVIGLLVFAVGLEWSLGLLPCSLCELQRLVFVLLAGFYLLGTLLPAGRFQQILINAGISLLALLGGILASRQIWLQHFPPPPGSGSCDASLYYLLQIMPWKDVLMTVFIGGPECAKIGWTFLGLNIPQWSLLFFIFFLFLALWQMLGYFLKGGRA